ncbi:MAG: MFS transporter [Shewanellaceae bacterium]|nr:MFS transporter [Shewanellaceae bacterium]
MKAIARTQYLSYASLALPMAFASIPLYLYTPDFYATRYQLSLSFMGMALLFLRLIDALQDPLIGYLSDRYPRHRIPAMFIAAGLLCVGFYGLYHPLTDAYTFWFVLFLFISTTAYSVVTINLNAIGGVWSDDHQQKLLIVGTREIFALFGVITAVFMPHIFAQQPNPYTLTSIVLTGLVGLGLWQFYQWQRQQPWLPALHPSTTASVIQAWRVAPSIRWFFGIYLISMLASSIPGVLVVFFIRDLLQLEAYTGLFLAVYFVSAMLSIPLWQAGAKRLGYATTWWYSMVLAIGFFSWAYALDAGDFWPYLMICVLSGMALGAEILLPPTLLADYIHQAHEQMQASFLFSLLTFIGKFCLALAIAASFLWLDAVDFVPQGANDADTLHRLSINYALVPCMLKAIAAAWLFRYRQAQS